MSCTTNQQAEKIKLDFHEKYKFFSPEELNICYNKALTDFVMLSYPSKNNRPPIDKITLDFYDSNWILSRMEDIVAREGCSSYESYRENGISFTYASSYIDKNLASMIRPKASVPI